MKPVTMFESTDGKIFAKEADVVRWERMCEAVEVVMLPLGDKPEDPHCKFANGDGYVQHDPNLRDFVKKKLVELANEYSPGFGYESEPDINLFGIVGRILSDSDSLRPIYSAWCRLGCIDSFGREWGQPYFAVNHPLNSRLWMGRPVLDAKTCERCGFGVATTNNLCDMCIRLDREIAIREKIEEAEEHQRRDGE